MEAFKGKSCTSLVNRRLMQAGPPSGGLWRHLLLSFHCKGNSGIFFLRKSSLGTENIGASTYLDFWGLDPAQ